MWSWHFLKVIFQRAWFWSFWNVVIVSLIFWPHNRLLSKHFSLQPLFPKDWGFFYCLLSQQILISISLEYAFPTHFLTSKHMLSIADKHHFSHIMVLWYCKVHIKSHHPNWYIKIVNSSAILSCWWIILIFLSSDMTGSVGHV